MSDRTRERTMADDVDVWCAGDHLHIGRSPCSRVAAAAATTASSIEGDPPGGKRSAKDLPGERQPPNEHTGSSRPRVRHPGLDAEA